MAASPLQSATRRLAAQIEHEHFILTNSIEFLFTKESFHEILRLPASTTTIEAAQAISGNTPCTQAGPLSGRHHTSLQMAANAPVNTLGHLVQAPAAARVARNILFYDASFEHARCSGHISCYRRDAREKQHRCTR